MVYGFQASVLRTDEERDDQSGRPPNGRATPTDEDRRCPVTKSDERGRCPWTKSMTMGDDADDERSRSSSVVTEASPASSSSCRRDRARGLPVQHTAKQQRKQVFTVFLLFLVPRLAHRDGAFVVVAQPELRQHQLCPYLFHHLLSTTRQLPLHPLSFIPFRSLLIFFFSFVAFAAASPFISTSVSWRFHSWFVPLALISPLGFSRFSWIRTSLVSPCNVDLTLTLSFACTASLSFTPRRCHDELSCLVCLHPLDLPLTWF